MNGVLPIAANLRRYGGHSDAVGSGELAGLPPEARSCLTRAKGGGEGGIRTPVPLAGQDAFEAPPLRPLRYLSRPVGEPQSYRDRLPVENQRGWPSDGRWPTASPSIARRRSSSADVTTPPADVKLRSAEVTSPFADVTSSTAVAGRQLRMSHDELRALFGRPQRLDSVSGVFRAAPATRTDKAPGAFREVSEKLTRG